MSDDIWSALEPQQETIVFRGKKFLVRELEFAVDGEMFKKADGMSRMLIACVFTPEGTPVWPTVPSEGETQEQADERVIATVAKLSKVAMNKLLDAAMRVNGWSTEANLEKPEAQV